MSEFVEVKAAELPEGPVLDWAVALATGETLIGESVQAGYILVGAGVDGDLQRKFAPSTDWAQGGELLDKYDIALNGGAIGGKRAIYATLRAVPDETPFATATGPTRLVAACRAIVSAKLGDVVQVPSVLVEVDA